MVEVVDMKPVVADRMAVAADTKLVVADKQVLAAEQADEQQVADMPKAAVVVGLVDWQTILQTLNTILRHQEDYQSHNPSVLQQSYP